MADQPNITNIPPNLPPTPPSPEVVVAAPASVGIKPADDPAPRPGQPHSARSEISLFIGWWVGAVLIALTTLGVLGAGYYLAVSYKLNVTFVLVLAALLALGLQLLLQQNLWLSRLMGLRLRPSAAGWQEAVFFWVTSVFGLMFRSTESPRRADGAKEAPPVDSVREVIETVVFVVVLVLMLKSFAAEAFVIPTGSMAETLYGYQKLITCPTCGHEFPINASSEVEQQAGGVTVPVTSGTCPNCLQSIRLTRAAPPKDQPPTGDWGEALVEDPGPNSGDRVLVAKFLYDLLGAPPDRMDVVVFKYPGNSHPTDHGPMSPEFPISGPQKQHTPMNYIKRLVGRSGEVILIRAGKLYVLPPDRVPEALLAHARGDREKTNDLLDMWKWEHMYENQFADTLERLFKEGQFDIVRKAPGVVVSMMRPVYDNDHPAKDMANQPRWQPAKGSNWVADKANGFVYAPTAASAGKLEWLRYHHLIRGNGGKRQLITDVMGYNPVSRSPTRPGVGDNWVSDLILETEVTVEKEQGQFVLQLAKGPDRFEARWDLAQGDLTLWRVAGGKEERLGQTTNHPLRKGTSRVRFANVDDQLTVWVDNSLPFGPKGVPYTPSSQPGPTLNDLEPASIGSKDAAVSVRHIKLFRDTYYTSQVSGNRPDVSIDDWTEGDAAAAGGDIPKAWRDLRKPPTKTLYVQPGHYLCMGDNSSQSSDGRSWGLVPDRLLLGRALLVYYPFSRAGRIR